MFRTIKLHIWKLRAPVQPSGRQPLGFGHSKPYYRNYVQPKCNRPDTRATLSGRGLDMEAFRATSERHRPDAQSSRPDTLGYFGHNFLFKYRIGTKLASLES